MSAASKWKGTAVLIVAVLGLTVSTSAVGDNSAPFPVSVVDHHQQWCGIPPISYCGGEIETGGAPVFKEVKKPSWLIGREGERKALRELKAWSAVYLSSLGIRWRLKLHPKGVALPDGTMRFPDIALFLKGKLSRYYEVKANRGRYTREQRRKDRWILKNLKVPTSLYRVRVKKTWTVCVKNCPVYPS